MHALMSCCVPFCTEQSAEPSVRSAIVSSSLTPLTHFRSKPSRGEITSEIETFRREGELTLSTLFAAILFLTSHFYVFTGARLLLLQQWPHKSRSARGLTWCYRCGCSSLFLRRITGRQGVKRVVRSFRDGAKSAKVFTQVT